jgi:hypothetical protein
MENDMMIDQPDPIDDGGTPSVPPPPPVATSPEVNRVPYLVIGGVVLAIIIAMLVFG